MIGRPHHVSSRWGAVVLLLCLGIAAAALLVRVPSIAAPLGIDQGLWATAVRAMARGQALYQDVWEQRPPGIYFVYLAGFRLLGWSTATVVWLDILAAAASTMLLAAIALRLSGRLAGALVAALFAALTMPAWLFGYGGLLERSVCETFIVVCVAIVAWCAVVLRERASIALALVGGLAAGAAVVLKPNAALYAPAIFGWWLVSAGRRSAGAKERLPLMAAAVIGCCVAPLATVWWLWHGGVLAEARYAIIDFNRAYLAQAFTWGAFAEGFAKAVWLRMKTDPLWLAGGVGSLLVGWELIRHRRLDPLASLAVWWGSAAAVVILVNGARLYTTYFIQAYAPLALLAGWVLLQIPRESLARRLVAVGTLGLMFFVLVQRGYVAKVVGGARADWAALRSDTTSPEYLERFGGYNNARGYSARAHAEVADYLQRQTRPEDRVFLFTTNAAAVYFLADRLPAHRFLRVNFFVGTPVEHPAFTLEAVVRDLRARRPVYLVFERLQSPSAWARAIDALREKDVLVDLLSGYRLETTIEDFTLYRRID